MGPASRCRLRPAGQLRAGHPSGRRPPARAGQDPAAAAAILERVCRDQCPEHPHSARFAPGGPGVPAGERRRLSVSSVHRPLHAAARFQAFGVHWMRRGGGVCDPVVCPRRRSEAAAGTLFSLPPFHLAKGVMLVLAGLAAGFVADQIKRRVMSVFLALEERQRIVNAFGQQVSPAIVEELLKQGPENPSKRTFVCVLFMDIRDFTRLVEKKRPRSSSRIRMPCSARRSRSWTATTAGSTSSWATASWRRSARRWPPAATVETP